MSDEASFRDGCFWSHTWIYYKVINYWSQRKRQLWGDFWLWYGADVLGIHIDLVVLLSWMCLKKHCSVGAEPPKSHNPEDPSSFAVGNCLLNFSWRRKNMHSYYKEITWINWQKPRMNQERYRSHEWGSSYKGTIRSVMVTLL